MRRKNRGQDDYYVYNHNNDKVEKNTGCSCSPTGCLLVVLLSIAIAIAVQECKRSNIRLERDREKYGKMHDMIQKQKIDTMSIKFNK